MSSLITPSYTTMVGKWNVRTMYAMCTEAKVAKEMRQYKINILDIGLGLDIILRGKDDCMVELGWRSKGRKTVGRPVDRPGRQCFNLLLNTMLYIKHCIVL